jgi:Ser/Thr protein kinase RdoA (MazF antagonist)
MARSVFSDCWTIGAIDGDMQIAARAAHYFLGGDIVKAEPLNAGTANHHYWVEDLAGNDYVLRRRSLRYADKAFAAYEAEYLACLAASGLPVPQLMAAPDGSLFCQLDGTLWQMSRRMSGSVYAGSVAHIQEAGNFLARIHNAAASFMPVHERMIMRFEAPDMLKNQFEQFRLSLSPASCHEKCFAWAECLIERLRETLSDTVCSKLPQLHIHGDYHSANLLFVHDTVSGLFDFDRSSLQARLRDVVDGVIFFGSKRKSPIDDRDIMSLTQGFRPDPASLHVFLQSYQDEVLIPLTSDEIKLLPDFIAARFLGMRLDGMAKLPEQMRHTMLDQDIEEPLGWLNANGLAINI